MAVRSCCPSVLIVVLTVLMIAVQIDQSSAKRKYSGTSQFVCKFISCVKLGDVSIRMYVFPQVTCVAENVLILN